MTRFEKARIISARALQISMGAPVLLDKKIGGKPAELARKEMEEGVIPLTVRLKEPPRME
ncbi:MAG: DNA-directed RNA polymerase subunit K [Candidatus Aenigmatarchaeota archaeon]